MSIRVAFIINSSRKLNSNSIQTLDLVNFDPRLSSLLLYTKRPKHAIELAEKYCNEGYDCIVSVGGDGTNNEVVNGIQRSKRRKEVIFGIIPNGSGDDFQKMLGEFRPAEFVGMLLTQQSKSIDLIQLTSENKTWYALNIAGIGFDGHVVGILEKFRKRWGLKGKFAYALAILNSFITFRKTEISITADSFHYVGKILMLAVCNGKAFGHGLFIHPDAEFSDGELGITLLGDVSFIDYVRNIGKLKRGEKIDHPGISYFNSKQISVRFHEKSLYTEVDGENLGQVPYDFQVLSNRLKIIH